MSKSNIELLIKVTASVRDNPDVKVVIGSIVLDEITIVKDNKSLIRKFLEWIKGLGK